MNTVLTFILLSACVATAYSVTCYTCLLCSDTFDESDQGNSTGCTYCKKNRAGAAGVYTVSRSCETTCTESSFSLFGISSKDTCCQEDYCNGASSVVLSLAALCAPTIVALVKNVL